MAAVEEESAAALALLESMRGAMSSLDYRGVIAYSRENQVQNMELSHTAQGGVERERLVSLSGPMREVVRHGEVVKCFLHDTKTVFTESKPNGHDLLDLPANFSQLLPYYEFILGAHDRIATRDAQAVAIIAKDDLRYGRRVWVDVESKLPLKVEIIDGTETVVEQMVFSSLDLATPLPERLFEAPGSTPTGWSVSEEPAQLPIDSLRWTIQGVPAGFQIVGFRQLKHTPHNRPIEHLLLSDGLASVSVYFDEVGDGLVVGQQPVSSGAIQTFSRKIGNFLVTAVGEVPARTAQAIANGIHHR